jgi:ammonium transporter Rh
MVIIGFGFIMTYLKRYGYGSIGFNLLIVAFAIQWSLLVHGWINWNEGNGQFSLNLNKLVKMVSFFIVLMFCFRLIVADLTSVAVIISFGVIIGTVTSSQLIVMVLFEVVAQIANEFICINILKVF